MRDSDHVPRSGWRRILGRLREAQPRPRTELLTLLRSLDGRDVQLRSKADRFGRVDVWTGRLNAAQMHTGEVDLTLPSGEVSRVLVSWVGYVVDDGGREHGPFKTPVSLQ